MVLGFKSDAWAGGFVTTLWAIDVAGWICVAVAVTHMLVFAVLIRRDWVRMAAEAYALQLLASCDLLESRTVAIEPSCGRQEAAMAVGAATGGSKIAFPDALDVARHQARMRRGVSPRSHATSYGRPTRPGVARGNW